MIDWDKYCVDTNVLLRRIERNSSHHLTARHAIYRLMENGAILHLFPQSIREFWNVGTRPIKNNGLGLSVQEIELRLNDIEATCRVLHDADTVYDIWRELVVKHQVSGVQVHDCYLAASMKAHGLTHLLTFNPSDFQRYGITTLDPASI